jgi:mono/diheme cytochrome c family protein
MTMKFGWMNDGEAGRLPGLPGGRRALVAAAAVMTTAIASVATYAQAPAGSVWAGAYSAEQATRGKAAYGDNCAACHGPTLTGGDSAPPLAGSNFLNNWNNFPAGATPLASDPQLMGDIKILGTKPAQ